MELFLPKMAPLNVVNIFIISNILNKCQILYTIILKNLKIATNYTYIFFRGFWSTLAAVPNKTRVIQNHANYWWSVTALVVHTMTFETFQQLISYNGKTISVERGNNSLIISIRLSISLINYLQI